MNHVNRIHGDSKVDGSGEKVVEMTDCTKCDRQVKTSKLLLHYKRSHGCLPPGHEPGSFMCDQCPNVYISQLSLKMHLKTAHSGKIYKTTTKKHRKCPHCVKTFTTLTSYKEHLKVKHENSATFNCPECPRSFGTSKKLNNHKKLVHMRVKCEVCGQEICNSFMLRRHKASAHGIVPKDVYQCKLCPMFFSLELSLDKHIESKHGIIKPEFRGTL
mgnify:CR=1 FL=1